MWYKVIKSGSNIEVYCYEKNLPPPSPTEKIIEKMDWRGEVERNTTAGERREQRREQTLRDNKNNLRRMAREYFSTSSFFITLTYNNANHHGAEDIKKSDRKFKYFIKKCNEHLGNVEYLAVRELTKNGRIHYHVLLNSDRLTEIFERQKIQKNDNKQKRIERYFYNKLWSYGFVKLFLIDNKIDNIGAYLSKYMGKEMDWIQNSRLILKSKNIKKIEPQTDSIISNNINENLEHIESIAQKEIIDNENRKSVFTNFYKSEYLGLVKYYDINLNRLKDDSLKELLLTLCNDV